MTPGVEHVPLVSTLIRRIDPRRDVTCMRGVFRIGEARDRLVRVEVAAGRNPQPARVAAKVHVYLAAPRLEPDEADQVAAVAADRVDVDIAPADARVQRVGHPTRA